MAEVVQSHIEEMLPEVYELQQLGILSSAEGKSVIKTRTDFEYKMRRRISKKQDFIRFIDYEMKLEKLKQSRISKLGLNDVSEGAKYRSLQRIHFIYQKCLRKYKNDVPLWIQYIKYCKQVSSTRSLGLAFVEALKHNPNSVKLWIMSAKNEMEINKNVSAARSIFLRSLKFNSQSPELWIEYFRLEVLHVEKLIKRKMIMEACDKPSSTVGDEFMNFKTAKIVFSNSLNCIDFNSTILAGFTDIAKKTEFNGESLLKFLYESALKQFPSNSSLWICLTEFIIAKDTNKALSILKTALGTIQTFECLKEIIIFLIAFSEKIGDIQPIISEFINNDLSSLLLDSAETVIALAEKMIQSDLSGFLPEILEVSLKQHPGNKSLWLFKIHHVSDNPVKDLEEALIVLPEDTDIWSEYLTTLFLMDSEKCREAWHSLMKKNFSASLISQYLQFVYTSYGLESTRAVFRNIQNQHTISEDVLVAMIRYEIAGETNAEVICNLFDSLTTSHCTSNNWKKYIDFCQENCPEKISSVLWKCKKVLSESQIAAIL